jgi:hypothetical protein
MYTFGFIVGHGFRVLLTEMRKKLNAMDAEWKAKMEQLYARKRGNMCLTIAFIFGLSSLD